MTWKVGYLAWNSLLPAHASPLCLPGLGSRESDPLGTSVVHTLYDTVGESVALHSGRSIETSLRLAPQTQEKQTALERTCPLLFYICNCTSHSSPSKVFEGFCCLGNYSKKYFLIASHFLTILSNAGISVSHQHCTCQIKNLRLVQDHSIHECNLLFERESSLTNRKDLSPVPQRHLHKY